MFGKLWASSIRELLGPTPSETRLEAKRQEPRLNQ